ncbi:hypothetical protein B0H67DRAFT_386237 [Lasiosphaeris hirsuta]|uniref:Uncharacterized protein n=1 Tax=Lasiosphaeris hirsuta TaxID=260670 RepID=A0AA39ZXR6_9PEZI|nr:hypothetical protein B0H67DRAFT_386237 [Lasiosphaeris hirsuta]
MSLATRVILAFACMPPECTCLEHGLEVGKAPSCSSHLLSASPQALRQKRQTPLLSTLPRAGFSKALAASLHSPGLLILELSFSFHSTTKVVQSPDVFLVLSELPRKFCTTLPNCWPAVQTTCTVSTDQKTHCLGGNLSWLHSSSAGEALSAACCCAPGLPQRGQVL